MLEERGGKSPPSFPNHCEGHDTLSDNFIQRITEIEGALLHNPRWGLGVIPHYSYYTRSCGRNSKSIIICLMNHGDQYSK
jgi:hypothetical protein